MNEWNKTARLQLSFNFLWHSSCMANNDQVLAIIQANLALLPSFLLLKSISPELISFFISLLRVVRVLPWRILPFLLPLLYSFIHAVTFLVFLESFINGGICPVIGALQPQSCFLLFIIVWVHSHHCQLHLLCQQEATPVQADLLPLPCRLWRQSQHCHLSDPCLPS